MDRQKLRRPILWSVALGAVFFGLRARESAMRAQAESPFGKYTLRQVLHLTESLCRIIAPESGSITLSADRYEMSGQRTWSVECVDVEGHPIAFVFWNADSGEFWSITHSPADLRSRWTLELNREQAELEARRWLRNVGIAQKAPNWTISSSQKEDGVWRVAFTAAGRAASIIMADSSGDLKSANYRSR